jgi:hypothetical protein
MDGCELAMRLREGLADAQAISWSRKPAMTTRRYANASCKLASKLLVQAVQRGGTGKYLDHA